MHCFRKHIVLSLSLTVVFLLLSYSIVFAQANWYTCIVDSNVIDADEWEAAKTCMQIDDYHAPCISYVKGPFNGERFELKLALVEGENDWYSVLVDPDTWGYASFALNSSIYDANISYRYGHMYGQGILKRAYQDYPGWFTETVDPATGLQDPAIAFNSADNPVIVYGSGTYPDPQNMKMAEWSGVDWNISIIDPNGKCEEISLAYDSQGHPHISYVLTSGGCFLKYAHWNGINWEFEVLDTITSGYSTSIALDSNDQPHIAYHYATEGIWYTNKVGTIWETDQVEDENAWYARLAFHPNGKPCLAYYLADQGALKFATIMNDEWVTQIIEDDPDPSIRIGRFPSIAKDYFSAINISYYYHEAGQPCMLKCASGYFPRPQIELTPENPPIQIPANGGSFQFNIAVENNSMEPDTIAVWSMIYGPGSREFGPIIRVEDMIVSAGWSGNVNRIQEIPAIAPPGNYSYRAYLGAAYPSVISMDLFLFEKLETADGSSRIETWNCRGESFTAEYESVNEKAGIVPSQSSIFSAAPNPFNASTTIDFNLQISEYITLAIYDITGREVESLITGHSSAGQHSVVWDARDYASGVYFVKLEAGKSIKTQKLLLLK